MAIIFGIQFGSKFGSTKKYESKLIKEKNDFERFNELDQSETLRRYNELDQLIHSGDFEKKVQFLKSAKFKNSEEYRQLEQYKSMKASKDVKSYLNYSKSGKLDRIKSIIESDLLKEFNDLKVFVNSSAFHSAKVKKDFKQSEAYAKQEQFNTLKKDPEITFYLKQEKSNEYRTVAKLENSERLKSFFKLESIIQSPEFIDKKTFLEDKNRFKKSEEARLIEEFNELQKNEDVKWYQKTKKLNPFKEIRKWEITFEDDFDALQLDKSRWMTGYYWGKALMNDNYVLAGEKQFFKEDNIEMHDSVVRINTQKEAYRGKVWDATHGFTMQDFEYTSGLISTGQSFRQKYGKFEAKIKFSQAFPVVNAFWLVGEKMLPQLDVFKTSLKKGKALESGIHVSAPEGQALNLLKKITGANFKNGYFIYTLDWSPEALIWKINGIEVHREVKHVPDEPMYLSFCTILPEYPSDNQMPSYMDIDWIRCYRKKEA
ncbi:glycoside hydrolase family 16 protein [Natronoflexus pectinivorans]|uniref:Glycosyl hydrolase family 16 n=1 Tax=Natronoflexus pectinivorans TaxID=682526 RepID=A0A4R2GFH4_9BACT|nr:glycoside hydrolase family 16 protein [Natronoflexus pectinivorans]TCO06958.1 glycosyl hydrolase family 16 [Natronoflexus pectinivorans]